MYYLASSGVADYVRPDYNNSAALPVDKIKGQEEIASCPHRFINPLKIFKTISTTPPNYHLLIAD